MKSFAAFVMLTALVLLSEGYGIGYHLKKQYIKSAVRQHLQNRQYSDPDIMHFSFSTERGKVTAENFDWEEYGKEFRWNGLLYDVLKIEQSKDQITIHCLPDADETAFENVFKRIPSQQNKSIPLSTQLIKLIQHGFEPANETFFFPLQLISFVWYTGQDTGLFNTFSGQIFTPPERKG